MYPLGIWLVLYTSEVTFVHKYFQIECLETPRLYSMSIIKIMSVLPNLLNLLLLYFLNSDTVSTIPALQARNTSS